MLEYYYHFDNTLTSCIYDNSGVATTKLHRWFDRPNPKQHDGPLHSSFQIYCGHSRPMNLREVVTLTCAAPLYAWGRYLFVAANATSEYIHVAEVGVNTWVQQSMTN